MGLEKELSSVFNRFLHSGNYVAGKEVEAFESEWAEYCQAKYCVGVSSGTDALFLALKALKDLIPGNKVLTTPSTFFATTQIIMANGCTPWFSDVGYDGNLPGSSFDRWVNMLAIPVDLYGKPGDWKGNNLIIDRAQSHGAVPHGRGLLECYSFYPTKNLGALGQAGAITTNEEALYKTLKEMRIYGERERFVHYNDTGNHRMDEIQAAVLRVKLKKLYGWNEMRRSIASYYWERLSLLPTEVLLLPEPHPNHVYHIYAIRSPYRDSLASYLKDHNIQTAIRYPVPMHLQPAVKIHHSFSEGAYPMAEAWARENLSLPMYPELPIESLKYVCDIINRWADWVDKLKQQER